MIKRVLQSADFSTFAEAAVVAFTLIFVVVVARTLMIRRNVAARQARIVLDDLSVDSKASEIQTDETT